MTIPQSLETAILNKAIEYKAISKADAKALTDSKAFERCLQALVENGYQPSAAVDKLAEIAVETGHFKSKGDWKRYLALK